MPAAYDAFFQTATGNAPYAHQRRLAGVPPASEISNLKSQMRAARPPSAPCRSQPISIPTGLGKTAAVVLAWLEPLLRVATCDFSTRDIDHWKLALPAFQHGNPPPSRPARLLLYLKITRAKKIINVVGLYP